MTPRNSTISAAALLPTVDWGATALGPRAAWPAARAAFLAGLFASPAPSLALLGRHGVAIYNDAFAGLIGDRHPALFGRAAAEAWPEMRDFVRAALADAWRMRGATVRECGLGAPGEAAYRRLDAYAGPIVEPAGVAGALIMVVDRSRAVRAEARRAEGHELYRSLLELGPEVTWSADPEGRIVDFSQRWLTLTGLDREQALTGGWKQVVPEQDQPRIGVALARSIRTGAAFDVEHRVRTADGSHRWMRSRAFPRRDDRGHIVMWHGTTEDISRRKALEGRQARLLELADRLRAAKGPADVIEAAALSIGSELAATRVGFGTLDGPGDDLAIETEWTDGGVDRLPRLLHLDELVPGRVADLKAGATVTVTGSADPGTGTGSGGLISGAVVPLVRDGRLRAVFFLGHDRARAWNADEVAIAGDIAARIWDALERAQAATLLRRNQARQSFLLVLGDRLREALDAGEVKEIVAEALGRHLHAARVGYGELTDAGDALVFENSWTDQGTEPIGPVVPLADLGETSREDLGRGLTIAFDADRGDPQARPGPDIAVPLIRDGRLRAVLAVRHAGSWSAEDRALVGEVAARLWDALERVRAEAALRDLNATLERRVEERAAELASSEARFRTLFESAPASIVLIRVRSGGTAVIEAANAATERFFGRPIAEIVGRGVAELRSAGDILLARCLDCARTGEPAQFEISIEDGAQPRTAESVLAPLPADPDGRLLIGISRDITAQRRAEEQLRQAQKMEAIGQLTGGIAHDFNNLLTGIIGALAMMQKRLDQGRPEAIARYTEMAMNSANRAAALTHRLLAFSRRQPLEARPLDVNGLVQSMDDLLRRTLGEGVALQTVAARDLWTTFCDAHQLENALLNLAINARDAMPEGGRLTIETANAVIGAEVAMGQPGLNPGDYIRLSVIDTGQGMPEDVLARAFDPFFTTKPIGQGTGLGLSMIYGFVKQSDGYTRISSEVGRGTTVDLFLPRFEGAADPRADSPPHAAPSRAGAGETVLVVEDDPTVRGLVLDVLQELRYKAIEASDGPSGLRVLQSDRRIDLLVTDVGLPGMNGRQLAAQARLDRPGLKVLFITGYAENAAFGAGLDDPGLQLMTKPFAVEALATRIRSMVGQD